MIAYHNNQLAFPFDMTSTEAILQVLTRCTTVWIDIDKWRLLDVLKTDGLDLIWNAKLFQDNNDLDSAQRLAKAVISKQRGVSHFPRIRARSWRHRY